MIVDRVFLLLAARCGGVAASAPSAADWTFAHEIGHDTGRFHDQPTGTPIDRSGEANHRSMSASTDRVTPVEISWQ